MNGTVESVAFNSDGSRLFSVGDDGEVYVWDMNRRQCIHRFIDEGCIQGTSLAVSNNSQYLACGSVCNFFFFLQSEVYFVCYQYSGDVVS